MSNLPQPDQLGSPESDPTVASLRFTPPPGEAVELFDIYLAAYALTMAGVPLDSSRVHAWSETSRILASVIGVEDGKKNSRRTKTLLIQAIGDGLMS